MECGILYVISTRTDGVLYQRLDSASSLCGCEGAIELCWYVYMPILIRDIDSNLWLLHLMSVGLRLPIATMRILPYVSQS